ncbi:FMN-binding protein [Alloiococcus sp. CFN-8]|uniref:FMN-binding protein n=1 Tax=Alloiococcus sp. CFN-8 TaxID=3416081 RepID=UPI003CED9539
MKRFLSVVLTGLIAMSMVACSSGGEEETLTGVGKGIGGELKVEVKKEGEKIVSVKVTEHKETEGIADPALKDIPAAIVKANSTDVDVISGATVTSKAIIAAVNNALDPEKYPAPEKEEAGSGSVTAADVYQGFGITSVPRVGPGKDDTDTPVYSFNEVFANVLFDGEGKILSLIIDQLEVATPNYDGDGMPHFSGYPGQGGYNNDENHDGKIDGKTADTEDRFVEEIKGWTTKRERGDKYIVGSSTWTAQMEAFEKLFTGMTVDEVEEWFKKYTSDINGRPLKAESEDEKDKAKFNALTDAEKKELADVTSGATMSLKDPHGDIIGAIKNAYENRIALDIKGATKQGMGLNFMPRIGPGKDDTGTPVYSINQVFANTLFDKDGKIAALHIDQLEFATPNYDGDGMPHLSGFPGQGGYNNNENHDEKVDGKTADTEEQFTSEVNGWVTKRARGDKYIVGASTWTDQIEVFEKLFVGKTVEEVEQWFKKYTSDINGRPLKAEAEDEKDKAKYSALTDAEKKDLADVTSGATMSLNDPHGDIISAIKKSLESAREINLEIK